MKATDIKWVTDGEDVNLPNEVEIPAQLEDDEDAITDYLSDTYGWLVESYSLSTDEQFVCPKCGHVFVQGEMDYNYDFGTLDFECPECGWTGNENGLKRS